MASMEQKSDGTINISLSKEEATYIMAGSMSKCISLIGDKIATEWLSKNKDELLQKVTNSPDIENRIQMRVEAAVRDEAIEFFFKALYKKANEKFKANP